MSWYERALKIRERELGIDHINSADTIMGIGLVYFSQGKYAEAMSWYKRALKIFEREFGVDHVNSASTWFNIGLVYKDMADWMSAKSVTRAMCCWNYASGPVTIYMLVSHRLR